MQVLFESRHPEGARLRELAERRLRFAIRRFIWLVPRAKLYLSDVNGPRGGLDKRCQVELKTHSGGTVVIMALAGDWRSALETALARAARALVRSLQRGRDHHRPRHRAIGFDH